MNGRHVFLSPHRDDAILSCGGLLAMLARGQRRALIVNVFGGAEAPATLSDYSIELLANLDAASFPDAVALRSAEDQRACAIVGAKRDELPFVPAPIRAPEYASWDAIVGEIPACDAGLHERIVEELAGRSLLTPESVVFAPLAIGRHVDHRIVHRVGRALAGRGHRVAFFEDFPYCVNPGALDGFVFPGDCEPHCISVGKFADTKFEAIRCYRSQVPQLFPDGICTALAANAKRLGRDDMVERYWAPRANDGLPAIEAALAAMVRP